MRYQFPHAVVAGLDGGQHAPAVVDYAAAEADLRGLPLILVAAHPEDGTGPGPETCLTAYLRRVCTTWPALPVTARNVTGLLAEELIDISRDASLVVLGRTGTALANRVAAHTRCPTVVLPPEVAVAATDPVLVGVGLTSDDEPTIGFGFEEAARRRVALLAVHVWSGIPAAAIGKISPFSYDLRRAQSAADGMLARTLAGWTEKYPEVRVEQMALYDANPAQTLLDASDRAGLVVVGAHRRGLGGSQLIGSVTRTLIARSTRPVAVIGAGKHLW